jgi:hypothetical protein
MLLFEEDVSVTFSVSFSLSLPVFCAACQCFKTLFSVLNTCHFKIFNTTTCFNLNWPNLWVTNRQGNNEEQAHMRNKGTNEHDWKETAVSLETSINTWRWPIWAETCSGFKDFKVTSVENSEKCLKTLASRTKDGQGKWKWNSNVRQDANVQYYNIFRFFTFIKFDLCYLIKTLEEMKNIAL